MKISFQTPNDSSKLTGINGYGYATVCMLDSLRQLGYQVKDNDPSADVQIAFNQPHNWVFDKDAYKIGYHPWESTLLLEGWAEIMNQCDEIWTPSPLIADWYTRYSGITVPVFVYEHGIEHEWSPVKREPEDFFKFLMVGNETRKGGWFTVQAFRKAFSGAKYRDDVKLTYKMVNCPTPLPNSRRTERGFVGEMGRVTYINEAWSIGDMRELFYHHDVYVYPSAGEGFGLTPLQALATGMPTISVPAWAPYARFMDPALSLPSKLMASPWEIHPGMVFDIDEDDIVDRMRYAVDNYAEVRDFACVNSFEVHKEYDWLELTSKTFSDLESRLQTS